MIKEENIMKKLLIVTTLALCLVLTAVACTGDDQPADTTADTVVDTTVDTKADTTVDTTADETSADTTVDETVADTTADTSVADETVADTTADTTEEETPGESLPTLPYVDKWELGSDFVKSRMDVFYQNGENYFSGFPNADMADDKLEQVAENKITFAEGTPVESVGAYGWIGFTKAIESFGYYIGTELTYNPDFTHVGEDAEAVKGAAGQYATRYNITIPLEGLEKGSYEVGFVAKLADGTVARIHGITVVIE